MLGDKIKALRKERKLNQQELADMLNVECSNISKWELGKNKPSIDVLEKIADYFRVSVEYLLDRTDLPQNTEIAPDGEIENELLNICKKLSIEKKAKLLIYAYELVKKPYEQ